MSALIENCPTLNQCCCCVPLRPSLVIISLVGLLCGGVFLFCFTSYGNSMLEDCGLPQQFAKPLRYLYGLFGVQVSAVHVLLLFAAVSESDALCEVYIWFMVLFWTLLICSTALVSSLAFVSGSVMFASLLIVIVVVGILVSLYSTMIVANFRMTLP
ncbi:hypothetical protein KGM_215235 [Danaus plexippus plexippus]|uniref:Uncharacterized protein n=1 Tax=Danaus plexippus plexippus TaxID=278856 RepID=A0A212FBU6_DANPL|nr:uncharacterized protein LOC116774071 [Danaus plexippus plexippus]OWR51188.1 hypothetical protein KGM_215235 [Danaus plexippus plexippus]